jgi:peptidoglycan/xylan/chitin deacetylase (PgdA/CDA1 family)
VGIRFGAHTESHPILSRCSLKEQRNEITGSQNALTRLVRYPSSVFAYPNGQRGDWSRETERIVAESGFTAALTTLTGTNTPHTPRFALRRITMDRTDDFDSFLLAVSCVRGLLQMLRGMFKP